MRIQTRHRRATATIALACALACAPALAGPYAASTAYSDAERLAHMSLEDLLQTEVTSLAGIAEPAFATPAAITVITAEEIRRAGHRSLPEALRMEDGFDQATLDGLRKKGHKVSVVDRWSFGSAKIIVRDRENGCWLGGADPRRVAYALGY